MPKDADRQTEYVVNSICRKLHSSITANATCMLYVCIYLDVYILISPCGAICACISVDHLSFNRGPSLNIADKSRYLDSDSYWEVIIIKSATNSLALAIEALASNSKL